jgi:hypothetical protein
VVGQRKGPSGANAPPVHGIKKCLDRSIYCTLVYIVLLGEHTNKFFLSKSWHDYDFGTMIFGKENLSIFAVYT